MLLGLADLAFAAAAAVYVKSAQAPNPALALWCTGRALLGFGLVLVWARYLVPLSPLPTLAQLLILAGSALELAAYAELAGRKRWHHRLLAVAGALLLMRLAWNLLDLPDGMRPVYFSAAMAGLYGAMAAVLLYRRLPSSLERLIGINNLSLALLFALRAGWGLVAGGLSPSTPSIPNLAIWLVSLVVSVLNAFGFLLVSKQQEDARLAQALARTAAAEAEQRALLSMASHEFRTPAAMIQTSLDSLRFLRNEITPAVASRIDNIALALRRLSRLANVLICNDRLGEARIDAQYRPLDPGALARAVADSYPTPVRCTSAPGLPPIEGDEDLLRIALQNLIDNALTHGAGAEPPRVRLKRSGGFIEMAVADTGVGVADADKARILERFQRGNASRGSGNGLAIVRKIARLHGGDVLVTDNQPRGAVFTLRLPLRPPTAARAADR